MLVTHHLVFEAMKAREKEYIKDGLPGCDERMVEHIENLSKFPYIACVFCCQGHPENKMKITVNTGGPDAAQYVYQEREKGYILFAMQNQAGIDLLTHIFATMSRYEPTRNAIDLSLCLQQMEYFETGFEPNGITMPKHYFAMTIEWEVDTAGDVDKYLTALSKSIEELHSYLNL